MTGSTRDPGAAGERTFLAWHRTGLATLVVAAILLKAERFAVAAVIVAVAGAFELVGSRRLRSLHDGVALPPALPRKTVRLVSLGVVVTALLAALTV